MIQSTSATKTLDVFERAVSDDENPSMSAAKIEATATVSRYLERPDTGRLNSDCVWPEKDIVVSEFRSLTSED